MKTRIIEELNNIEQIYNVRILFAIESGSRAWGFASPDSDYDVRFVYVRPINEYLRLDKRRDVIEHMLDDVLDINGWDLDKTLKLLHNSNPTLFEWCNSPIMYKTSSFHEEFKQIMPKYFLSNAGIYHYLSTAKGNYREYLKGDMVKMKKYFYVLRPILACKWILENGSPPPMLFSDLVESQLEETLKPVVEGLLELKMSADETETIPRIDILNTWIEDSIEFISDKISQYPRQEKEDWDGLNEIFLKEVYR